MDQDRTELAHAIHAVAQALADTRRPKKPKSWFLTPIPAKSPADYLAQALVVGAAVPGMTLAAGFVYQLWLQAQGS